MTTPALLASLASALSAAGYPVGLTPAVPVAWPAVIIGAPTITPLAGACPGPCQVSTPVTVTGAGVTAEHVLDLLTAVDAVLQAVPAGWAAVVAQPVDPPDERPAYQITCETEV